jgi:hypothetical protein
MGKGTRETLRKKRTGHKGIKKTLKMFADREKNGLSVNDISQTGVQCSTIYAKARGKIMSVDDHAINSLRVWFDIEYEELKKEWKSNEYEKLKSKQTMPMFGNRLKRLSSAQVIV